MQFRRNRTLSQPATRGKRQSATSRGVSWPAFPALFALSVFLPALLTDTPARAASLHYDAFLSGLPIGSAVVELVLEDRAYRISGTASSQGVAHMFSDWRSDFLAEGHLREGAPVLRVYAYDERERKKQRVLWLSEGMVRHVKNDQVRPSHPVLTGTDVLTAFFLQPDCWSERQLHTGRYSYQLTGRPTSDSVGDTVECLFSATDKDGERTRFYVRFGTHKGLRIPIEARTTGLLRGRIRLRTATPPASADGETADLMLSELP